MLHRFGINAVVLLVSSDEFHEARLALVVDRCDQAILVSSEVEYGSATFENTC
jgi:hypothetical protein